MAKQTTMPTLEEIQAFQERLNQFNLGVAEQFGEILNSIGEPLTKLVASCPPELTVGNPESVNQLHSFMHFYTHQTNQASAIVARLTPPVAIDDGTEAAPL